MRKASDQRLLWRFFDNVAMPCNGRAADSPFSAAEAPREGDFSAPALGCTARLETVQSAGVDDDLQHVLKLAVKAVLLNLSSLSCVGGVGKACAPLSWRRGHAAYSLVRSEHA